ncbi:MAG TPA: VOC family protein [Verrucomicrobiae bacterium]|jgi:predicted enzyme related to lactoylglutathione lyase|nr:VOC family protein [Verrucomicrobiae bacterium]
MAQDIKLIVYPVKDLAAAKTLYGKYLGVEPYADAPYYVGYKLSNLEVGLVPGGQEAVISYIEVDDIKGYLQDLVDAGATTHQEPKDVANGLLVAQVKDASGNILGLRQSPK